jgi:hypothetical protein
MTTTPTSGRRSAGRAAGRPLKSPLAVPGGLAPGAVQPWKRGLLVLRGVVCVLARRGTRPDMTAPPGACAREGVPWPVRRPPHGERHIMAPAGRYSMKAVV